jgi:adenylylsulfate kinase-like enzyme
MVIWVTGKKGSGKTEYAKKIANNFWFKLWNKPILLDDNEIRKYFPMGFSDEDDEKHILKVSKFASILEAQGFTVLISLMCPRKKWRQRARKFFKESKLIHLSGGTLLTGTMYEVPSNDELRVQFYGRPKKKTILWKN